MQQLEADTLIVIDVQAAFVTGSDSVPGHAALLSATGTAIGAARAAGAPVIFLQNDGEPGTPDEPYQPGWHLHFPQRSGDIIVRKRMDDGFQETELNDILVKLNARTLLLCGVLSEMCVAATARGAIQRGYGVILPHDAHATYDVPPGPGGSAGVPASMAARAAEWSLGDQIMIVPSVQDVRFSSRAKNSSRLGSSSHSTKNTNYFSSHVEIPERPTFLGCRQKHKEQ